MSVVERVEHITTKNLIEIKENNYRSKHCKKDYSEESINKELARRAQKTANDFIKLVDKESKPKKSNSRWIKCSCSNCGYQFRTSKSWILKGLPTCVCGGAFTPNSDLVIPF
jgi:hypothetical protein